MRLASSRRDSVTYRGPTPSRADPVSPADAARAVIEAYLRAAVFVTPRKLASIFRLLFSEAEMNSAIAELVGANKAQATKTCVLFAGIDAQTW